MKRLFWIAVGATVGVVVVRKLSQKADQFTPAGLAEQLTTSAREVGGAVRAFTEEIRVGMQAREDELRANLGVDDHQANGYRGMDADAAARLADERYQRWRDTP